MFKQLDLFANIPDEPPKREETKEVPVAVANGAEAITAEEEAAAFIATEESFTVETVNDPAPEETVAAIEAPAAEKAKEEISVIKEKKRSAPAPVKAEKGKRGRKSLKAMQQESDFIAIPEDEILFKKQYYSIGEVSQMFRLNSSLLRYWETEFDIIKPRKNRKGDRHFRPEDIKNLYLIHHLLRQRKYTIEGAKEYLKKNKAKAQQHFEIIQRLQKLKGFLLELKAGL